jgi:predicted transcriptional regulator
MGHNTIAAMREFSIQTEFEVLELLVEDSPCHRTEITTAVDGHPITIDQACTNLHSQGYIAPISNGLYEITDAGEHRFESQHDS